MDQPPPLPAAAPCGSCPYRVDVPSGVWHPSEYVKLPQFDEPTALQPMEVFMCHQVDGRICAGWAGCHDMNHSLGVRLAYLEGHLTPDEVDALYAYATTVPLFASGREAAEHGMADAGAPSPAARRTAEKILKRRHAPAAPTTEENR
jgi:hypothetical protein